MRCPIYVHHHYHHRHCMRCSIECLTKCKCNDHLLIGLMTTVTNIATFMHYRITCNQLLPIGDSSACSTAGPHCLHCGKIYSNASNSKLHIRNVHCFIDASMQRECEACGKNAQNQTRFNQSSIASTWTWTPPVCAMMMMIMLCAMKASPIASKMKRKEKQFILRIKLNINRQFQANYSPRIFFLWFNHYYDLIMLLLFLCSLVFLFRLFFFLVLIFTAHTHTHRMFFLSYTCDIYVVFMLLLSFNYD